MASKKHGGSSSAPAPSSDTHAVVRLSPAAHAALAALHPARSSFLWDELTTDGYVVLGVHVQERIAGYVVVCALATPEVHMIFVAPRFRRRGLARALMNKAISEFHTLQLEVRADNAAAIALYESLGFRCVGRRTGYYQGADALLYNCKN